MRWWPTPSSSFAAPLPLPLPVPLLNASDKDLLTPPSTLRFLKLLSLLNLSLLNLSTSRSLSKISWKCDSTRCGLSPGGVGVVGCGSTWIVIKRG